MKLRKSLQVALMAAFGAGWRLIPFASLALPLTACSLLAPVPQPPPLPLHSVAVTAGQTDVIWLRTPSGRIFRCWYNDTSVCQEAVTIGPTAALRPGAARKAPAAADPPPHPAPQVPPVTD